MPLSNEQWNAPAAGGDFYDYQITQSARFLGNSYLTKTNFGTDTSTTKKCASVWCKRSLINNSDAIQQVMNGYIQDVVNDSIMFEADGISYYGAGGGRNGHAKYKNRDVSAWYHIAVIIDTTQATAANRFKLYINGVEIAIIATNFTFDSDGLPVRNAAVGYGKASSQMDIGRYAPYGTNLFTGLIAEVIVIDGPGSIDDFGEFKNGVWKPVDPSGLTFGTNGFHLDFANSSAFGNDVSGNNNDFSVGNLSTHDKMLDTPTFNSDNGGNFATLNPIAGSAENILTEGNLKATKETGSYNECTPATMNLRGKYYLECCAKELLAQNLACIGLVNVLEDLTNGGRDSRLDATGVSYREDGQLQTAGNAASFGDAWEAGDIIQMAVDATNINSIKVWFGNNNVWQNSSDPAAGGGIAATITNGEQIMAMSAGYSGTGELIFNFGQEGTFAGEKTAGGNADANGYGNFFYEPPTNFLALCTGNLPDPAADSAADDGPYKYFAPKLYTGDGASTLAITGLQFQPDWTWIKNRDATDAHMFFDSSRGVTQRLTIDTAVEATDADTLKSFTSDGFTVGDDVKCNTNTEKYVSWNWKINGGTTSSETDGGINTTCQTDADRGISIIQYAGDGGSSNVTMEHNLGVKPEFLIMKDRDSNGNNNQWGSWHHTSGFGKYAYWSTTAAPAASTNGTVSAVSDELITFQRSGTTGGSQTRFENGDNFIIYAFASKEGFSKFGTYEGSGAADGAFVYTGFTPALVITKSIDSTSSWHIFDNLREGYNVDNDELLVEATTVEGTADMIDILSNGFKCRIASDPNVAETYIFLAWAEFPFKYAYGSGSPN